MFKAIRCFLSLFYHENIKEQEHVDVKLHSVITFSSGVAKRREKDNLRRIIRGLARLKQHSSCRGGEQVNVELGGGKCCIIVVGGGVVDVLVVVK